MTAKQSTFATPQEIFCASDAAAAKAPKFSSFAQAFTEPEPFKEAMCKWFLCRSVPEQQKLLNRLSLLRHDYIYERKGMDALQQLGKEILACFVVKPTEATQLSCGEMLFELMPEMLDNWCDTISSVRQKDPEPAEEWDIDFPHQFPHQWKFVAAEHPRRYVLKQLFPHLQSICRIKQNDTLWAKYSKCDWGFVNPKTIDADIEKAMTHMLR